ncbi:adenosylcobalamin-dependent ribonucleoside-diphosphate reductase [Rhodovibrionaceae bacterium A322]
MSKLSPLSEQIWRSKYQLKSDEGQPVDRTLADSWVRVASALASAEADPAAWQDKFLSALQDFKFLPAGRILAGAGSQRQVTLFNCFVMGNIPDSMDGIFSHLREAALTLQQGGGIGYDFSSLRPRGAPVLGLGSDASGPVSFMDVWDAMCATILSAGSRRGAMMATLRCDHPDIEDFITAKQQAGRLTNFNLSVLVSDAFMTAVRQDASWDLQFDGKTQRQLSARALWRKIMEATYDSAEPGVIFIDRINAENNLSYCESITATNPCGEQPLPAYGACLLGSLNLAALVRNPFEKDAHLDLEELTRLTGLAARMLDNAIEVSRFPLEAQRREAMAKRRIGLGVTGLADALIYCGQTYGSQEAVATVELWLRHLRDAAYQASCELAQEKGPFPLFDREALLARPQIKRLPQELQDAIAAHGLRNGLLTSIAPTGTISLLAGNVSSGLEPVFAFEHDRLIRQPDGSHRRESVMNPAYARFRQLFGAEAALPDYFVDANSLSPQAHLVMQAAVQRYIDASVSKTINLPESIAFEEFEQVYLNAYDLGCKGCTTYRPSAVRGAVLTSAPAPGPLPTGSPPPAAVSEPGQAPEPGAEAAGDQPTSVVYMTEPLARPDMLQGRSYKLFWPESDHAIYITINDVEQDGRLRPFEVFINSKNMEHYAWTVALTRMISAVFRRGGDVSFVVQELKAVFDPRGGAWMEGKYVPSLLAAIGGVIERHLREIGFLSDQDKAELQIPKAQAEGLSGDSSQPILARQCPRCGTAALIRQEGCDICTNCGHSKCG